MARRTAEVPWSFHDWVKYFPFVPFGQSFRPSPLATDKAHSRCSKLFSCSCLRIGPPRSWLIPDTVRFPPHRNQAELVANRHDLAVKLPHVSRLARENLVLWIAPV